MLPPKARFIEPMLLQRAEMLPAGPDWVYELKLDGYIQGDDFAVDHRLVGHGGQRLSDRREPGAEILVASARIGPALV